jgi:heterotetrameric sarcosine oxidase gamma subunit
MLELPAPSAPSAPAAMDCNDASALALTTIRGPGLMLLSTARNGPGIGVELAHALGYAPPEAPLRCARSRRGDGFCLWHAPRQWLIGTAPAERSSMEQALRNALAERTFCLLDCTGALEGLRVAGPGAAALLAKGCLLDFGEAAFPMGTGTRTLFAEQDVFAIRGEAAAVYDLFYDASLGHSMRGWFRTVSGLEAR